MTGHADRIRRGYAASGRGDIAAATQDLADDFVGEGPGPIDLPMGGEHADRAAALQVLQRAKLGQVKSRVNRGDLCWHVA